MLNQHSAFFIQKFARDGEKLTIRSGKRPRQQTERRMSDMTREDLKKIIEGITDEQLKSILDINSADIGKAKGDYSTLKAENDTLKSGKEELEKKIKELSDNLSTADDYKKQLEDLKDEIKRQKDEEKEKAEDAALTEAITAVFQDKKFTSDYVKNGIIADMKAEIAKPENKGKGYADIFESLTKDKPGIFENPNQLKDMTGMGSFEDGTSEETMRAIMGLAPSKE